MSAKLKGNVALIAALGLALHAAPALAQFQNHNLGLTAGYLSLRGVTGDGIDWGVPIGLSGGIYIENGFDLVGHVGVMILYDQAVGHNVVGLDGPSVGVRYLFREDSIRPYVGVDLSYLHFFGTLDLVTDYFGLGPNVGIDFFVSDSISIGVRGRYNLYVAFFPQWAFFNSFGANLDVAAYF